jgi:hypothetical protein
MNLHMAHTNNTAINPAVRRRFGTALGIYGQAPPRISRPLPPPADDVSFVAAQTAAREWADKALDLGQAGDTEQARYARFRAEASLVKMLALEAHEGRLNHDKLPIARSRAQRRSPPRERQEVKLNNAALRSWPRSLLREQGE